MTDKTQEESRADMTPCEERWYAVYTQPHAESRAVSHLNHQEFRTFCPRARKTVRHARKVTRALVPLFPNYIFVRLDISRDPWRSVNGTRGVIRVVGQGDFPVPVPAGIVEALLDRADQEGTINWVPLLKEGQAVRISDGPFMDFVGTLETLDGSGRVRVLLDLLGQLVGVTLPCRAVVPAS